MGAPGVTPPAPVTLAEQVAAVIREIGMRRAVYPGRVAIGKMKQEKADHEVRAMETVLATVRDYQAMQPKVLALHVVVSVLAGKLMMDNGELMGLLANAEADAVHRLGQGVDLSRATAESRGEVPLP